jgi:chemotaxis signal transduction protein
VSRTAAAPPAPALATGHVVVRVGTERFAFRVGDVEEAMDAPLLTPVPLAPAGLLGQMRYRDRTVRAFDAAWMFGVARRGGAGTALVFRAGSERMGLLVDDVEDLAEVAPGDVRPVPPGADAEGLLRGVCLATDGRVVALVRTAAMVARASAERTRDGEPER